MTRLSVEIAACLYFYSGGSSNCEKQLLSASVIGKFVGSLAWMISANFGVNGVRRSFI